MATFDSRLLTPPKMEEEVYPYRRAWRSLGIESGLLFALTVVLYILIDFIGFGFPDQAERLVAWALALVPAALWIVFSWFSERLVPEPRRHLLTVAIISGLVARAVGIPVVEDVLEVNRWLPNTNSIGRIVGYTFTLGITHEFLKYLVVRYFVWPQQFRIRLDSIAYAAAGAVGYVTVLNLHFVATNSAPPDITAIRIFNATALHFASAIIVAYGLSELRFSYPLFLLPTVTLGISASLFGFVTAFRGGLVNANLFVPISISNPLIGFIFTALILAGTIFAMVFLYNVAERDSRDPSEL